MSRRLTAVIALPTVVAIAIVAAWQALEPPTLDPPSRSSFVLRDVTLVEAGSPSRSHVDLWIDAGRIERVVPAQAAGVSSRPPYAGSFVAAGLIDMHFHIPPWWAPGQSELFALLLLSHGVTAIRDMGSVGVSVFELREAIREGDRPGPRIFTCGEILDGDSPVWRFARVVASEEEAEKAVADLVAAGADCIKVYSEVAPPVLEALRRSASEHRLPLVGHLPRSAAWTEDRIGDIQHVCDPRCWTMTEDDAEVLVRTAAAMHLAHTPTLAVYAMQLAMNDWERARSRPSLRLLPRFWSDVIWDPRYRLGFEPPLPEDEVNRRADHEALLQSLMKIVRAMQSAGVRLHAGTDPPNPLIVPGASLHEELMLFVRAGLTPEEAWAAATTTAGASLRQPGLGTLREGAPADLLILDRDPTRDLAALSTLRAVIADGRLYSRETLEAALAAQRRHFDGPVFARTAAWTARAAVEIGRRANGALSTAR